MRVSDDVLKVLSAAELNGNSLVLQGQLDRAAYVAVNKVLEAAGWKWNRKAKAHTCDGEAVDVLEQVLLTGQVTVAKNEFGEFFTPAAIAADLVQRANVSDKWCLEPSAGNGVIAREIVAQGGDVDCYEIQERNIRKLADWGGMRNLIGCDFLTVDYNFLAGTEEGLYDRVVMNPPFARQQDIKHVMHAVNFLKPGGRLVSVMSASVTFRDDKLTNSFRALIEQCDGELEILPDGAFKESGTMVRTCIVTLDKPA